MEASNNNNNNENTTSANEKESTEESKNHSYKDSTNETEDQYSNSSFSPESKNDLDYQIRSQNDSYECPGAPQHPTINDSTPTPQRISSFASESQNNDYTTEYLRSSHNSYTSMPFVPVSPDMTNSDAGPSPSTPLASFSQTQYYGVSECNEYDFKDRVGSGTFGEVHKAKDSRTKEIVAMKHIYMANENEGVPITALREIKILKQLNHPNIIPLLEIAVKRGNRVARQRGALYMVFPYMDHDLAGLIENKNVEFTEPQIKCYMKQLFEGILYLHSNNIMHRDIKCANILINNQGQLQIGDFGLARSFDPDDKNKEYTNMVVTRWYRPPELLLGETRYTCAIDMWGLGCILGEILQRVPILRGESESDQLEKIWDLCGTPNEEIWPGFRNLPGCHDLTFKYPKPNCIEERFKNFNPLAVDLLKKLLTLDPKKRITAKEALTHDYFWTSPEPALPKDLPTYAPSHELDARKARKMANPDHQRQRYNKNLKYDSRKSSNINNYNSGRPSRHQAGKYGSNPNIYRPFPSRDQRHSSNPPIRQSYSSANSTFQPYTSGSNERSNHPPRSLDNGSSMNKHYR